MLPAGNDAMGAAATGSAAAIRLQLPQRSTRRRHHPPAAIARTLSGQWASGLCHILPATVHGHLSDGAHAARKRLTQLKVCGVEVKMSAHAVHGCALGDSFGFALTVAVE